MTILDQYNNIQEALAEAKKSLSKVPGLDRLHNIGTVLFCRSANNNQEKIIDRIPEEPHRHVSKPFTIPELVRWSGFHVTGMTESYMELITEISGPLPLYVRDFLDHLKEHMSQKEPAQTVTDEAPRTTREPRLDPRYLVDAKNFSACLISFRTKFRRACRAAHIKFLREAGDDIVTEFYQTLPIALSGRSVYGNFAGIIDLQYMKVVCRPGNIYAIKFVSVDAMDVITEYALTTGKITNPYESHLTHLLRDPNIPNSAKGIVLDSFVGFSLRKNARLKNNITFKIYTGEKETVITLTPQNSRCKGLLRQGVTEPKEQGKIKIEDLKYVLLVPYHGFHPHQDFVILDVKAKTLIFFQVRRESMLTFSSNATFYSFHSPLTSGTR